MVFGIFRWIFVGGRRSRSGLEARPVPRYGSASREPCGTWADLGRVGWNCSRLKKKGEKKGNMPNLS